MSGNDYLKQWYRIQLILAVLLGILVIGHDFTIRATVTISAMFLVVVALIALTVDMYVRAPSWLEIINRWLQAFLQPLMLVIAWGFITRLLITHLHLPARGVTALMCVYYVGMFAPFAEVIGKGFQWSLARLFFLTYWFVWIVQGQLFMFPQQLALSNHLEMLMEAGTFGAVAFLVLTTTLMREWHLSWPGIKPTNLQWWVVLLLLLVAAAAIFTNYGGMKHITFVNLATAIEAGIAEETLARFGYLGILLKGMENVTSRVPIAIAISALLFGVLHLSNLVAQSVSMTMYQMVVAISFGLLFAVIYLYTGQLWLTMLIHFLIDFFAFAATGNTSMTGAVHSYQWLYPTVVLVLAILLTAWMMFGPRRQVIEDNARRFTGSDQRFGYKINYWSSHSY